MAVENGSRGDGCRSGSELQQLVFPELWRLEGLNPGPVGLWCPEQMAATRPLSSVPLGCDPCAQDGACSLPRRPWDPRLQNQAGGAGLVPSPSTPGDQ